MINDNKAFNLRVKAVSRLKALPSINKESYVLDSTQPKINSQLDTDFNKAYKGFLSQAMASVREENYETAIHHFTNILKLDPKDNNVLIDRARCFHKLGKTQIALKDLDVVLSNDPNHARAILAKAEMLYDIGEYKSALSMYEDGYKKRNDMTAFAIGIEKTKKSIESSFSQTLIQPDTLLDYATKEKKGLEELDIDLHFLNEFETNACPNSTMGQQVKDLLLFIKNQNEILIKRQQKQQKQQQQGKKKAKSKYSKK